MKTALLCVAWVALCASIVGLFVGIDLDLNFFSWIGVWKFQSVACAIGILILLISSFLLSVYRQNRIVLTVASISCVMLIIFGIWAASPEKLGNPQHWLYRSSASPDWYRWGRLVVSFLPLFLLMSARIYFMRFQNRTAQHR